MNKYKYLTLLMAVMVPVFCNAQQMGEIGFDKEAYRLPDSTSIDYWEDQTNYKRVIHVSQRHPLAKDSNDGSPDKPLLTIQQAADIAMPGDSVLIGEGIYRETVRPQRGGRSSNEMICYRGVDRAKVIITGTEVYEGVYQASEGWVPYRFWSGEKRKIDAMVIFDESQEQTETDLPAKKAFPVRHTDSDDLFKQAGAQAYMFRLPREKFIGTNPFSMVNGPLIPWVGNGASFIFNWAKTDTQKNLALMHRGMLFCDGKMLKQVPQYVDMAGNPGSFFVEDDGLTVHVRLADDSHPGQHQIEYTAREQCFSPEHRYNGYIKIENITFQKAGNGFPPPQRGIVSTNCGHHFIVNNCVIEDANGIGLDIGFELPSRYSMAERGYHIVANSEFNRCGIAAICGTTGSSDIDYYDFQQDAILIYNNKLRDNCWQDFSQLHESATIKLHHIRNSMLVGNYIENNMYGHGGIWLDAANENVSINENVIHKSLEGGIYIEASTHLNEIANNVIIDVKQLGVRGSESDHIRCYRNLILGSGQAGIRLGYGGTRYFLGQTFTGKGVEIIENIISQSPVAVSIPISEANVDGNVYGTFESDNYLGIGKEKKVYTLGDWQKAFGLDLRGIHASIRYRYSPATHTLELHIGDKTFDVALEGSVKSEIGRIIESIDRD